MDKKLIISVIITLLYSVFTLIAVLHHEIWADEAQVWQLCKYLSVPELINHLHNEGHPSLFYLLVMPFAKTIPDIICMQIICWFFMCAAVFLLFYFSPFKLITKFAIILSAGFLYFLPVIARSYSILPFLLFAAAALYSNQKRYPVLYCLNIALIANTHAIMFVFAFILSVYFIYDNIIENLKEKQKTVRELGQYIIAAVIAVTALIILILQLYNSSSSNSCISFSFDNIFDKTEKVAVYFFINAYNQMITLERTMFNPVVDIALISILFITFILLFKGLYKNSRKLFYLAFLSIGFQFFIYIFLYTVHTYVTRIFSALIILIFCYWVIIKQKECDYEYNHTQGKKAGILLSILFFLTSYNGINFYIQEIKYNYAGAKEASEYIKSNIDSKKSILLISNEPYCISLAYYLGEDYKLYSVLREKELKYVKWDDIMQKRLHPASWGNAAEYYLLQFGQNKDVYIVNSFFDEKYDEPDNKNFNLVYRTQKIIEGIEGYSIYKYNINPM